MSKFYDWYSKNGDTDLSLCKIVSSDFLVKKLREAFEAGQQAGPDWISVSDRLPENCKPVYVKGLDYQGYPVEAIAQYCRKFEFEASEGTDEEWCEYNPENDTLYVPEGWYEANTCAEIDYATDFTITDWHPLQKIN